MVNFEQIKQQPKLGDNVFTEQGIGEIAKIEKEKYQIRITQPFTKSWGTITVK